MKPNSIGQAVYQRHVKHLNRNASHLGDAENLEDVMKVVEEIKPNVYMLAKSCVDRTPIIQLANWEIIRRIGLKELDTKNRNQLIFNLSLLGIEYRKTKYLALNPDFTPTSECIHQERFGAIYNLYYEFRVQFFEMKKRLDFSR